jgi:hypothetical protein
MINKLSYMADGQDSWLLIRRMTWWLTAAFLMHDGSIWAGVEEGGGVLLGVGVTNTIREI